MKVSVIIPFYNNLDGSKKKNDDLELPYPNLSQFKIYTQ
jgi:hypothetical protein